MTPDCIKDYTCGETHCASVRLCSVIQMSEQPWVQSTLKPCFQANSAPCRLLLILKNEPNSQWLQNWPTRLRGPVFTWSLDTVCQRWSALIHLCSHLWNVPYKETRFAARSRDFCHKCLFIYITMEMSVFYSRHGAEANFTGNIQQLTLRKCISVQSVIATATGAEATRHSQQQIVQY